MAQSGGVVCRVGIELDNDPGAGKAKCQSEQAADGREQQGLGDQQGHDLHLSCAQGLAQSDLGGALGHRHEHDVHDQDAGHHQADGGDPGHGQGQDLEDLVKGGQDRILGDDGHILLAVMPFGNGGLDMGFQPVEDRQILGLDQDAEQALGVEQCLGKGHRHDHQFLGVEAQ